MRGRSPRALAFWSCPGSIWEARTCGWARGGDALAAAVSEGPLSIFLSPPLPPRLGERLPNGCGQDFIRRASPLSPGIGLRGYSRSEKPRSAAVSMVCPKLLLPIEHARVPMLSASKLGGTGTSSARGLGWKAAAPVLVALRAAVWVEVVHTFRYRVIPKRLASEETPSIWPALTLNWEKLFLSAKHADTMMPGRFPHLLLNCYEMN